MNYAIAELNRESGIKASHVEQIFINLLELSRVVLLHMLHNGQISRNENTCIHLLTHSASKFCTNWQFHYRSFGEYFAFSSVFLEIKYVNPRYIHKLDKI